MDLFTQITNVYPELTDAEVEKIIETIKRFIS